MASSYFAQPATDIAPSVALAEASLTATSTPPSLPCQEEPCGLPTPPSSPPHGGEGVVPAQSTPEAAVLTAVALESATPLPTPLPGLEASPTPSPTPSLTPTSTATPEKTATPSPPIFYYAQAGDTLPVLSIRFGVPVEDIFSQELIPPSGLISPGQLLLIPNVLGETAPPNQLMPDSEVVYSPSAVDFDIHAFVEEAGGYLASYCEYLGSTGKTCGGDLVKRVALENSINPRLLLALLEYEAHWVYGQPTNLAESFYPLGILERERRGLFQQLSWAVGQLSRGYYAWREGRITDLVFPDGRTMRLAPGANAGTVAVQVLFAQLYDIEPWGGALYAPEGLISLYEKMFGNPWLIAQNVEPLLPATLSQPPLLLPFPLGQVWSYTGGPHAAWNHEGARAALDFAPPSTESGCVPSNVWVTAAATGLVLRSDKGVVILDLDGDGNEQTGWVLLYLHIATNGRIKAGTWVEAGGLIGHPSCEGGQATGTHVHIARKYNGEWIPADGPLPFDLSGWQAKAGDQPYQGSLLKENQVVEACTCSSAATFLSRTKDE